MSSVSSILVFLEVLTFHQDILKNVEKKTLDFALQKDESTLVSNFGFEKKVNKIPFSP